MRKIAAIAFALTLMAFSAGYALADRPGSDWMPAEQVILMLKAHGYSSIYEIGADDGRWEGKGMKDGKVMKFHADPRTGAITRERPSH